MVIMLAGAGGGYMYVKKLQKDNLTLKINQSKLETAIEDNNAVIEQQTSDLKLIRSTLSNLEEEKKKLQERKEVFFSSSISFLIDFLIYEHVA